MWYALSTLGVHTSIGIGKSGQVLLDYDCPHVGPGLGVEYNDKGWMKERRDEGN